MAIQFFCSSCRKPIEIDDEAASQAVTCPYCNTTVIAPASSDPSAALTPTAPPPSGPPPEVPLSYGPPPLATRSPLGWIALTCCVLLIAYMGIAMLVGIYLAKTLPAGTSQADVMKAVNQRMQTPAMMALSLAGTCAIPLVGVGCAVAALIRKVQPRWPAILSLVVIGGFWAFLCLGTLFKVSQMAGAKTGG